MFLVLLNYTKPLAEIDQAIPDHRNFLERYYASGHFLLSGRKEPRTGGVILVQADSRSEVEAMVRQDPFHERQLAEYEIIEFLPSMATAHLEGLKAL